MIELDLLITLRVKDGMMYTVRAPDRQITLTYAQEESLLRSRFECSTEERKYLRRLTPMIAEAGVMRSA